MRLSFIYTRYFPYILTYWLDFVHWKLIFFLLMLFGGQRNVEVGRTSGCGKKSGKVVFPFNMLLMYSKSFHYTGFWLVDFFDCVFNEISSEKYVPARMELSNNDRYLITRSIYEKKTFLGKEVSEVYKFLRNLQSQVRLHIQKVTHCRSKPQSRFIFYQRQSQVR